MAVKMITEMMNKGIKGARRHHPDRGLSLLIAPVTGAGLSRTAMLILLSYI